MDIPIQSTHERLKDLIAHYVLRFNYWGYLFARIRRRPDPTLKSIMGVGPERDGTITLYYRPELINTTDDKTIEKVLEHEGMHLLNNHIPRSMRFISMQMHILEIKSRMDLMNYAMDCSANSQAKLPEVLQIGGKPWKLHHPKLYNLPDNKIWEFYYGELFKKAKKIQIPSFSGGSGEGKQKCPNCGGTGKDPDKNEQPSQCPSCGGSGRDDTNQPCPQCNGTGQGKDDQSQQGQGQGNQPGQGGQQPGQGQGGQGGGDQPCPVCGGTGDCGGSGGLDDHGHWQGSGENPDLDSMARKIETHVSGIVRESVKQFQRSRGTLPSHLQELIDSILAPPKVPYYQLIRKYVRGTRYSKFKRSFTTLNRKRTFLFAINEDGIPEISPFPGRKRDFSFKIGILIDTSGSQGLDDICEALRGTKSIIESDRHTQTTVIEIDTVIQKEYKVKKVRDIDPQVKGRGGTTLGAGLKRFRELGVDVCLAFTDGETENINLIPRKIMPKKTIWVIGEESGTSRNINRTGPIVKVPGL
jgi:predicted metal-dependent peptidase